MTLLPVGVEFLPVLIACKEDLNASTYLAPKAASSLLRLVSVNIASTFCCHTSNIFFLPSVFSVLSKSDVIVPPGQLLAGALGLLFLLISNNLSANAFKSG